MARHARRIKCTLTTGRRPARAHVIATILRLGILALVVANTATAVVDTQTAETLFGTAAAEPAQIAFHAIARIRAVRIVIRTINVSLALARPKRDPIEQSVALLGAALTVALTGIATILTRTGFAP